MTAEGVNKLVFFSSWLTSGSSTARREGWQMEPARSTTTLKTHQALMARWGYSAACVKLYMWEVQAGDEASVVCVWHVSRICLVNEIKSDRIK